MKSKKTFIHIYFLCTCTYIMFASTWQRTGFRFLVSEGLATTMWLIGVAAIFRCVAYSIVVEYLWRTADLEYL